MQRNNFSRGKIITAPKKKFIVENLRVLTKFYISPFNAENLSARFINILSFLFVWKYQVFVFKCPRIKRCFIFSYKFDRSSVIADCYSLMTTILSLLHAGNPFKMPILTLILIKNCLLSYEKENCLDKNDFVNMA